MITHDYHSNNHDGSNWAALRTFSKNRHILDNEHVRQDGPLRLGQDGPGPSCPNPLYDALWFLVQRISLFFSSIDMMIKLVEIVYGVLNIIAC